MDIPVTYLWQTVYLAAVLETDNTAMPIGFTRRGRNRTKASQSDRYRRYGVQKNRKRATRIANALRPGELSLLLVLMLLNRVSQRYFRLWAFNCSGMKLTLVSAQANQHERLAL
jgi:hypothetical protein